MFSRISRRVSVICLLISGIRVLLPAEIIDRVAISVGNQVITSGQIDLEVRVTAFLNQEEFDLSPILRKNAANRLIEQTLIKRDMAFSRYPLPAMADADASLQDVKAKYAGDAQYQDALRKYRISEEDLKDRLLWQLTVLRFIDYRFRPGIQIADSEVRAYFQDQLADLRQKGVNPLPELSDVRSKITEVLTQQRIDDTLDHWLAETRLQVPIRYHDEALH
jgi:peptidyl-prolyl cis-trans isomerase SurA